MYVVLGQNNHKSFTCFFSIDKRYDFSPPKYTTFHHLVYVARWSLTSFRVFFFKKIKNKIKWGTT
jgi:hypothetical protein